MNFPLVLEPWNGENTLLYLSSCALKSNENNSVFPLLSTGLYMHHQPQEKKKEGGGVSL